MKGKKIVFTNPWEVELQEADLQKPAKDEVLIKNHYSVISAGTELACLSGSESDWFKMPASPGYAAVGEILAKGEDVKNFEVGERVFHYGIHAQYQVCKAGGFIIKVGETKNEAYIPFTRMATIAYTAIRVSSIEVGDDVVVMGQGLIGNLAGQLARLQGARVIAVDISDQRLAVAKVCGAYATINSAKSDFVQEIKALTEGRGASTLIEATGNPKVALSSTGAIARRGEMILLGTPRGEYVTNVVPFLRNSHICEFDISIKGAHEWKYPTRRDAYAKHSLERNTHITFGHMEREELKIAPLLSKMVLPEQMKQAYKGLKNSQDKFIGVVIDWTK